MGKEVFPYLKKIKKGKLWEKSYSHIKKIKKRKVMGKELFP